MTLPFNPLKLLADQNSKLGKRMQEMTDAEVKSRFPRTTAFVKAGKAAPNAAFLKAIFSDLGSTALTKSDLVSMVQPGPLGAGEAMGAEALLRHMTENPEGFTIPQAGGALAGENAGKVAVAGVPGATKHSGPATLESVQAFLAKNAKLLRENPDLHFGGWTDKSTGETMSELTSLHQPADVMSVLKARPAEKAAFHLGDMREIPNPYYEPAGKPLAGAKGEPTHEHLTNAASLISLADQGVVPMDEALQSGIQARLDEAVRRTPALAEHMPNMETAEPGDLKGIVNNLMDLSRRVEHGAPLSPSIEAPTVLTRPTGENIFDTKNLGYPEKMDVSAPAQKEVTGRAKLDALNPMLETIAREGPGLVDMSLKLHPQMKYWYNMTPAERAFHDVLGSEGPDAWKRFVNFIGITSPQTPWAGNDALGTLRGPNLEQAGALYHLWKSGQLTPETINRLYSMYPEGVWKPMSFEGVQQGLEHALAPESSVSPTAFKEQRYTAPMIPNAEWAYPWGGVTIDRIMNQLGGVPGLAKAKSGGLVTKTGVPFPTKPGWVNTSPRASQYGPIENAWRNVFSKFDLPPTAGQSLVWGLAGSSDEPALAMFERLLQRRAGITGQHPLDVLKSFIKGGTVLGAAGLGAEALSPDESQAQTGPGLGLPMPPHVVNALDSLQQHLKAPSIYSYDPMKVVDFVDSLSNAMTPRSAADSVAQRRVMEANLVP